MLEGGEDPRFIARRMVILASEDVGNADPMALVVATAAAAAVDRVGLPECALNLGQAAAYLALAPKSNASMRGISRRDGHVREHGAKLPPDYLRDAHYAGARKLGRGPGLRLPPRRARGGRRPAAAAGGGRGRALLRAHRPRLRGRASPAPRPRFRRRRVRTARRPSADIQSAPMGTLESLNPATGELVGAVTTIEPDAGPGGRRRRRRGAALLGPALARRSRPLHAPRRRRPRRADGRRRAPAHQRAGQADHRELHDGAAADDRRPALARRRRARGSSPTSGSPTRRRS